MELAIDLLLFQWLTKKLRRGSRAYAGRTFRFLTAEFCDPFAEFFTSGVLVEGFNFGLEILNDSFVGLRQGSQIC